MWLVKVANDGKQRVVVPQDTLVASAQSLRATVHSLRVSHDRQIAARFSGVGAKSVSERAKETNIKEAAFATMKAQYNDAFYKLLAAEDTEVYVNCKSEDSNRTKLEEYDRPLEDVLGITAYPEDGDVALTAAQMQHVDPVLCGHSSVAEATAATDHTCASMLEDCIHLQRLIWHVLHGIDPNPEHIIVRFSNSLLSYFGVSTNYVVLYKSGQHKYMAYEDKKWEFNAANNTVYNGIKKELYTRNTNHPSKFGTGYKSSNGYSVSVWPAPHVTFNDNGDPCFTVGNTSTKITTVTVTPNGFVNNALYMPWAANVAARKTFVDLDVFRPDAFGFDDAIPVSVDDIDNTDFCLELSKGCPTDDEDFARNFVHLTKLRGAELDPAVQTVGMMQSTNPRKRKRIETAEYIAKLKTAYSHLKSKLSGLADFSGTITTREIEQSRTQLTELRENSTTADTTKKHIVTALIRLADLEIKPEKLRWSVGVRGSPLLTALEVALAYTHNQLEVQHLTFAGWHYGALCADSGRQETSSAWIARSLLTNNQIDKPKSVDDYAKGLYKPVCVNIRGCETYGVTTVCAAAGLFVKTAAYDNALTQLRLTALNVNDVDANKWQDALTNNPDGGGTSFAYKLNTAHAFLQSTATATEKWHDKRVLYELQTRLHWVVSAWFPSDNIKYERS